MDDTETSRQIDGILQMHGGWKSEILTRIRAVILLTDSRIVEEIKWRTASRPEGLPVWSLGGMLCFAEIWKDNVKLIFVNGSQLTDPDKMFNARLKSTAIRAIEFHESDPVDVAALKKLVQAAIKINESKS